MDDREFALTMRRSLIQLADHASDPESKRALLRMVAAFEKRYGLGKLRVVPDKAAPIRRDDSVA